MNCSSCDRHCRSKRSATPPNAAVPNLSLIHIYPEASLSFFYGNGAAFNKTGTRFLAADEGAHLYKVNQEGALEAVSAKYDEFEGAFAIRTKILGRYVISDLPLL